MATGVGLRISDDESVAAILTSAPGTDVVSEPLYIARESILHMSDDGDTALGGAAPPGYTHSITGFVAAVGDPAGMPVDDGEAYRAEDLFATAIFCLIDVATEHLSGAAEFYATYPGDWPTHHVQGLRDALNYLGLRSVTLVNETTLLNETGSPATDSSVPPVVDPATAAPRERAARAARAALAAVLTTPAGTAPPDPSTAESALEVTDILPPIPVPGPSTEAYSAAMPAPAPIVDGPPAPIPPPATTKRNRRGPLIIALAAALIGLVIGGTAVAAVLLRAGPPAPGPSPDLSGRADASSTMVTTTTALPPPPPPPPPPPRTTVAAPPPRQQIPVAPAITTPPPATPPPPPVVAVPPPDTGAPRTTDPDEPPTTTSRHHHWTNPWNPWANDDPDLPGPGLPLPGN